MLWDQIPADIRQSQLSFNLDGLEEERRCQKTIDVAYRYFHLQDKRYVLADTPGHLEYTSNLVSGLTQAQAVLLVVDARHGLTAQSHFHIQLCEWLQIPRRLLVVNKMDLVEHSQSRFEEIWSQLPSHWEALPCSALLDHNVRQKVTLLEWFQGPTLLEYLARLNPPPNLAPHPLRLCLQGPQMGQILSGQLQVGQTVFLKDTALQVNALRTLQGNTPQAQAGQTVWLECEPSLSLERGHFLTDRPLNPRRHLNAELLFFKPYHGQTFHGQPLHVVTRSGQSPCSIRAPQPLPSQPFQITPCQIQLELPLYCDAYSHNLPSGCLLLIDQGQTIAVGLIRPSPRVIWLTSLSGSGKSSLAQWLQARLPGPSLWLDGDHFRQGLSSDLGFSPQDRQENIRRAAQVAKIAHSQGQWVICSFISPYACDRQAARQLFAPEDFCEVYLDCPLEVCRQRDPKGLYANPPSQMTGLSSPYEIPSQPDICLSTSQLSLDQAGRLLLKSILD